jgi:hypothetical protein
MMMSIKTDVQTPVDGVWNYNGAKSKTIELDYDALHQYVIDQRRIGVHELLIGEKFRPYADLDFTADSADSFDDLKFNLLSKGMAAMEELFPTGDVMMFCSSSAEAMKISAHYVVNGIFYRSKEQIKFVMLGCDMKALHFDKQVYDKNKTMRLPLCSKPGQKRPLRFAECVRFNDCGMINYPPEDVESDLSCGLITYVQEDDEEMAEPAGFNASTEQDDTHLPNVVEGLRVLTIEQIQRYMTALKQERSIEFGSWRNCIWALQHLGSQQGMDLKQVARDFAKRATEYDEAATDLMYLKAAPKGNAITFGSVIFWARQDTPGLDDVKITVAQEPTYYEDKFDLLLTKPDVAQVQTWFLGSLSYVLTSEQWYLRFRDGWRPLPKCPKKFPFTTSSSSSSISIMGPKGKSVQKEFCDILKELKDLPEFEMCRFTREEYLPYFKVKPVKIFNLFEGWMHDFMEEKVSNDDVDVVRINAHLKDLCGGSNEVLAYSQRWYAMTIQQPQRKLPILVYYSAKQGTGKSMWFGFLEENVYGEKQVLKLTDMKVVLGHFNSASTQSQVVICEEAKDEGKSISDWQILKDMSMGTTRQTTVKKGCEAEKSRNYNKFLFSTNNKRAIQIEASDRRFVCNECSNEHVGDFPYFKELAKTLESKTAGSKYFNWLAQMDLTSFVPETIPMTQMKEDLKEDSLTTCQQHLRAVCEGKRPFGKITSEGEVIPHKDLFADYRIWCAEEGIQGKFMKIGKNYTIDLVAMGMKAPIQHTLSTGRLRGWHIVTEDIDCLFKRHLNMNRSILEMSDEDE